MTIIVYKITWTETGECYIGQTSQRLLARWTAHNSEARRAKKPNKFQQALLEKGRDGWALELIAICETVTEANEAEKAAIRACDSIARGFNTTIGGKTSKGRPITPELRAKMSASARAKPPVTEETRARLSQARKGKSHSPSHRAKIAAALKGKSRPESVKEKLRKANTGKSHTEEARRKISLAGKGRSLSDFQKQRLRAANLGKPRSETQILAKRKTWLLTDQKGRALIVDDLVGFCKQHGFCAGYFYRTKDGAAVYGWTVNRL